MIVFDAASSTTQTGGTTVTFAHTVGTGTGTILLVGVMPENNSDPALMVITGITYNTVAMTKINAITVANGSNRNRAELWYLMSPATGAHNVVVTATGANDYVCGSVSFFGADPTQPNANNTGSDTSLTATAVSTSATSTVVNCLLVDAVALHDQTRTITVGTGTQRVNATGSCIGGMSSRIVPAAGAAAATWTVSAGGSMWAQVTAAITPIPSSGIPLSLL